MQIKIVGSANLKPMEAQLKAAKIQAKLFNEELAKSSLIPAGGSPAGFRQTAREMAGMTRAFDSAMASSGAYRVEQVRLNDVIQKNTDLLRRQKLGFREVFGKKGSSARMMMDQVYREQGALREMMARSVQGGIGDGRLKASLYIPTDVHQSWDKLNNRVGMFGYQLSSASRELLNWGKNTQWAGRQLMAGLTFPMLAFGAAAGVMAYQADKQFTRIKKVYDTTADQFSDSVEEQKEAQRELDKLREDGLKTASTAARLYGSAMTDTLGVQAELAATGQKGATLQGATTEVMKNAMLGEIDYQTATKTTIALQQQLHASTSELADMWAYMNSVENATSLAMKDFAFAIPIALGPIRTMGGDLQDLGTLMTGMVAQGIEVGKAANAIKALPQRLSRPSKQIQAEFKALTGEDIIEINNRSGDNIITLLTDIYNVTNDLDDQSKKKVFAGLFGSFQLSTMSAMVNSMGDLQNGVNQVSDAQRIGTQSAEEWGNVQRKEIEAFQQSASGKFKIALETIKTSLQSAGEPFLEMASKVLTGVNKILSAFNAMPSAAKKGIMGLLILGAVIGPAIMLVGLLANLAGNMGLMAGWLLKLVTRFNILNKTEEANAIINKLAEKGLTNRATQTALLTERVQALTRALNEQAGVYNAGPGQGFVPLSQVGMPKREAVSLGMPGGLTTKNASLMHGARASELAKQEQSARRLSLLERTRLHDSVKMNIVQGDIAAKGAAQERIFGSAQKNVTGMGVSMGVMSAAMAATMISSNETVDSFAKWAMILAIGVPVLKQAATLSQLVFLNTKKAVGAQLAARATTVGTAASTAKLAGRWGTVAALTRGAGAAMLGIMGPLGWTITAVATIGFGIKKWMDHEKAITKEKYDQANAMYSQNRILADQLKIQEKQKKTLSTASPSDVEGLPTARDLSEEIKKDKSYDDILGNLTSDVPEVEKQALVMDKYRDILQATGGDAKKAKLYIEALYIAAGDGALEAQRKSAEWFEFIGTGFTDNDLSDLWRMQIQSIGNDTDLSSIKAQGVSLGKDLADAIAEGGKENADKTLNDFMLIYQEEISKTFDNLNDYMKTGLSGIGITNFEQMQEAYDKFMSFDSAQDQMAWIQEEFNLTGKAAEDAAGMFDALSGPMEIQYSLQKGTVQELADQLGIEEEILTLKQLQATWEWKLQTATASNSKELYKSQIRGLQFMKAAGLINQDMVDDGKLKIANELLMARGLKQQTSLVAALRLLFGGVKSEAEGAAAAVRSMNGGLNMAVLDAEQMKSVLKSGMTGVQEEIASAASDSFDASMDSAIEGAENHWEAKRDALEARHERQDKAMDARWERRKDALTAYYEARNEAIEKEIEAEEEAEDIRQKIFEAEERRITRMADLANRNIDFNVAVRTGDLDEAARIQNDARALTQGWALDDAAQDSGTASERKIQILQDQQDLLDKQQEKAEDALAKREDREREHLDKMQEMQSDALDKQSDNALGALRDRWENERDAFNDRITLFKSYIARDQKDLESWMTEVGLSYDDFGGSVQEKGDSWAQFFKKTLKKHVRQAGTEIASDNAWEQWGAEEAQKTLKGMGFGTPKEFKRFLRTGKLPKGFGKPEKPEHTVPDQAGSMGGYGNMDTFHVGGMVGRDFGGRKGVPRTTAGLHSSERLVRAQDGEFIVNRKAASKHQSTLEAINSGRVDRRRINRGSGVGGPTGLMAGLVTGMARGISKSFQNAVRATQTSSVGSSGGTNYNQYGPVGTGGRARPSVPGKGWSNSHDYRNGERSPLYAFESGRIIESRDITSGGSPGNGLYTAPNGQSYRSYGAMVKVRGQSGNVVTYAHLSPGTRAALGPVKAGQLVGLSGNTGNSSGFHTHFEWNGSYAAQQAFAQNGIGLKTGGYIQKDGMANIHKDEVVVDPKRTKALYGLVDNFSGVPGFWSWLSGLYKIGPDGMPVIDVPTTSTTAEDVATGSSKNDKGEVVKTGTYNVSWKTPLNTTPPALKKLMGLVDVLSLQEVYENRLGIVRQTLAEGGWGMGEYKNDSIVAYNKSKYSMIDSGNRGMNPKTNGGGTQRNRNAAWALLRGGGSQFYQMSAHTNPMFGQRTAGGRNWDIQREQYGTLSDMVTQFSKHAPVILGGDLNWELHRPGGIPISNLKSVLAGTSGLNGLNTHAGGGNVDHIMYGPGSKNVRSRILGGLPSDHNALLSDIQIPQLAKGGLIKWDNTIANLHKDERVLTADNTAALDRGLDNLAGGTNVEYNTYVTLNAADMDANDVAQKVIQIQRRQESRRPVRMGTR